MSHRGRDGFRAGGFTLIEVLVALVIVAVGMSALMGALSSSAKTVAYMQDKTFAEWVALNQIASVRIGLQQGQLPATGTTNGDIDLVNRTWHWRQDVVTSQVPGVVRIDVKVRPKEIKGGEDDSWYVTVSGIAGNALGTPGASASQVIWDPGLQTGLPGDGTNTGNQLGQPGSPGRGTTPTIPNPATPRVPVNPNR
ncbi:MAG: type II secretion system minor pseudopilin GspI [Steroidobacteraceae bacterium]